MAWSFDHSIECGVPPDFAWGFWTDVRNWALDADVDRVEIDGPFAAGTCGRTLSKSAGRIEWRIAEAQPGSAIVEFPLEGAVGRFAWTFDPAGSGVRMAQHVTLEGPQADSYAASFGPVLEAGIPEGMKKLGAAMADAYGRRP